MLANLHARSERCVRDKFKNLQIYKPRLAKNGGCRYTENYRGRNEWAFFVRTGSAPKRISQFQAPFEIIAFCEYSIYFIILGQDAGPDPSRGSWDGKSKFSVIHVKELIKFFSQKLNVLRSLYFLPIKARADFYFKVFLPSVTYGLVVRGSCGKSLFDELEKIHVRATRIIYGLD